MRFALTLSFVFLLVSTADARKPRRSACPPVVAPAVRSEPLPVLPAGATKEVAALFHEQLGDRFLQEGDRYLKESAGSKSKLALAIAEYDRAIDLEPNRRRYWLRSKATANVEQRERDRARLLQPPHDRYTLMVFDALAHEAWFKNPPRMLDHLSAGIALAEELGHTQPAARETGAGIWAAKRIKARIQLQRKSTDYAALIADGERLVALQEVNPHERLRGLDFLARLLAACPETKLRDPQRAVKLATEACELAKYAAALPVETLAAAQAATGDWAAAQDTLQLASQLVEERVVNYQKMVNYLPTLPGTPVEVAASPLGQRRKQLQEYARHFESQVPLKLGPEQAQLQLPSLDQPVDWLSWFEADYSNWVF